MGFYSDLFTWDHPYGEPAGPRHTLAHNDGACSLLIHWSGIDIDLLTDAERRQRLEHFYGILKRMTPEIAYEWHLWREPDDGPARRYLAYNDHIVRGHDVAQRIRGDIAAHLAPHGVSNEVALVLVYLPRSRLYLRAETALKHQAQAAEILQAHAQELMPHLPGGRLATVDEYADRITQSTNRSRHVSGGRSTIDESFLADEENAFSVAELLVSERPKQIDRHLEMDGQVTKVLLVFKYPDNPGPGWTLPILEHRVAMHIAHTIIAVDTRDALMASEGVQERTEGMLSNKGKDQEQKKANDHEKFRKEVTDNQLQVFRNAYIIHIHGDRGAVLAAAKTISAYIQQANGQVRDADYIQEEYYLAAAPGQGYTAPLLRPDHTWQIGNMLPLQVWPAGDSECPEILRLTRSGQLVTHGLTDKALVHTFVGGMTRSGKDANFVAEVGESYPVGVDYSFLEIGSSYKWLCHAYNGKDSYLTVDPEHTVVNPLPLFSTAQHNAEVPLNVTMCTETINALAFLLAGRTALDDHEKAAGQSALQLLYATPDNSRPAPNLKDYLIELEGLDADYHTTEQITAARRMASKLHSFLDTAEGRIFTRDENAALTPGMFGVDLKDVRKVSDQLTIFYIVFIGLRFTQMAFSNRRFTRIVLNELYELVRIAPDVIGALCSSIARLGGKERSFLTIITQDTSEVEALDPAILAQMPIRELLYRTDKWDHVAERLKVPAGVVDRWRKFPYPVGLPYRESIHGHGDQYYHQHLTFPNYVLNMADSSPTALDHKDQIEKLTADPFERIRMLGDKMKRPCP